MTNEEAIKNLKKLKSFHNGSYGTAIDIAVKSLEPTDKIEESNFSTEQYKADLQGAYDCGYAKALEQQPRWIPVSERLPKENEYIGNVRRYYLIQDEYGDMHVAYLNNVGWIHMDSLKAIDSEVIAWMPLPELYNTESENKE